MICPHCAADHADGTTFCPKSGQPIAQPHATAPTPLAALVFPKEGLDAKPRDAGALLEQALRLYAKHFVALVATAAVVLLPLGFLGAAARRSIGPDPSKVAELQERAERNQRRSIEYGKRALALRERLQSSGPAERAAAQAELDKLTDALARDQSGDVAALTESSIAIFKQLGTAMLLGLLLIPLQFLATLLAQAALIGIIGDRALGGSLSPVGAWALALRRLLPLLGVAILGGLAVGLGTLLCVLPGIALAVLFSLAAPVVMLEGKDSIGALQRSARLVRDHIGPVFLVVLTYGVLSFGSTWLLGQLKGTTGMVLGQLASAALFPLPTLLLVLLYLDIRRVDEGALEVELQGKMAGRG
jgi:hypothetical protein